jgi:hypothetical protein
MFIAEGIEIMESESTFTVSDQREREIIWDALSEYKKLSGSSEDAAQIDELIERVSRTFSWMR